MKETRSKVTKSELIVSQERLSKLQEEVAKIINPEGNEDYRYYVHILDMKTGLIIHAGNHCPVCAVEQSVKWIERNNIQHDENEGENNERVN